MAGISSRVPRLEFESGSGVRFRRRISNVTSGSIALEEDGRSSIDSTAGRGSYIDDNIISRADFTFKVVLLGDSSVGKTCLSSLLVHRKVTTDNTRSTIGFDHHIRELMTEGIPVMLNVWDTAGMEQFRNALVNQYYRNVNGIILVYDITNTESFQNVDTWYSEAIKYSEDSERLKMVLIGNKKDQETEREVSEEEGKRYAQSRNMAFVEVSAKDVKCLETLDNLLVTLSHQMLSDREEHSFTCSMSSVIRLEGLREDDWEMVDSPQGPIPANVYRAQDENVKMSFRNQLTSSLRTTVVRTNNRVSNTKCSAC